MSTFELLVDDLEVRAALSAARDRVSNLRPLLQALGEGVVERAKRRFDTSTGPDGATWKPNSATTLDMLARRLGKSYRKKSGALNSKGEARIAGKRPLIGESGDLRRQIVSLADAGSVTVSATSAYAAIQQFGGKTGARSWTHGAMIPARPFLPVTYSGALYPAERDEILETVNAWLSGNLP